MSYYLPALDGTHEADVARLDAWSQRYQTDEIRGELDAIRNEASTLHELVSGGCGDPDCEGPGNYSAATETHDTIRRYVEDVEYRLDLLDGVA